MILFFFTLFLVEEEGRAADMQRKLWAFGGKHHDVLSKFSIEGENMRTEDNSIVAEFGDRDP
jgi:hypothetical protein